MWRNLAFLLSPSADFLERKFLDHRAFSVGLLCFASPLCAGMWLWDHVIDPVGAQHTIGLRLLHFFMPAMGWIIWRFGNFRALACISTFFGLSLSVIFVAIIDRLAGGMAAGVGGFMYFQLGAIVFLQCFSLRWNFFFTLASAAIPQLLALAGYAPGFLHAQYAVLIWTCAMFTMLFQTGTAYNYLRRWQIERQLEVISNTDPMTGTGNRRSFMPLMADEVRRARRLHQGLALLAIDIDHFKCINDTYGHAAGDEVIRALANTCRKAARDIDALARLGGEEFAVLLPGTNLQQAVAAAERIRKAAGETEVHCLNGVAIRFSVSIGVAELHADDADEDHFLARADALLYQAKNSGRNRVCS